MKFTDEPFENIEIFTKLIDKGSAGRV